MKLQILSNLNYPIGNIINQELANSIQVRIAVAFMKYSGLKVIEESLNNCLNKNGKVEIIAGLDFKTTDPQAIKFLLNLKRSNLELSFFCFGDKQENKTDVVFHPKVYLFNKPRETTSIIGSTNLTGGGLISNFEVNTVITEEKPLYFSQLEAIYSSVKFTPSIFEPDEEYLNGYADVYSAFSKNEHKARNDKGVKKAIEEIERKEKELPGTVPTFKSLIIDGIKILTQNSEYAQLQDIGDYVLRRIEGNKNLEFNLTNFRANIRGAIYDELVGNDNPYNKELFETKGKYTGLYKLTNYGKQYRGR
ncbi:MAG TPA: phospholipase D-like domain-containing protein [Mucilaginibacter sp.]